MTIPRPANLVSCANEMAEHQAFLDETRALFGDEAADELAERIKAQEEEEDEPV